MTTTVTTPESLALELRAPTPRAHATLHELLEATQAWQARTFPTGTALPTVVHLARECVELALEAAQLEGGADDATRRRYLRELVDVLVLAAQAALRAGCDVGELAALFREKLDELAARTWQPADSQGVVEHVRPLEPAAAFADYLLARARSTFGAYERDAVLGRNPSAPAAPQYGAAALGGLAPRPVDALERLARDLAELPRTAATMEGRVLQAFTPAAVVVDNRMVDMVAATERARGLAAVLTGMARAAGPLVLALRHELLAMGCTLTPDPAGVPA